MATSYTNPGGSGSRNSIVVATSNIAGDPTKLIDGSFATGATGSTSWTLQSVVGKYLRFDFNGLGAKPIIDEAKWYQDATSTNGDWKWQGSNDAVLWTDLGASFTLGGVATQTHTTLNGNVTPYRYYQLVGVSGNCSGVPWLEEIEFRIGVNNVIFFNMPMLGM